VPQEFLRVLLARFAGSFLYIGASDLLPEAREPYSPWVFATAVAGVITLYGVARFI
jgi:zinc transporter ZupT